MNNLLLEHAGNLKNYGVLKNFTHKSVYQNYTCGDKVEIYLKINKEIIDKISYETESCLICQASCSILSDCLKNKKLSNVLIDIELFINTIFKKKIFQKSKWNKFNFLFNKNYFNRKNCILVPFNAIIKLK
jgi:nitrogen fixation NifU-like protein